jgi:hypothetical protein
MRPPPAILLVLAALFGGCGGDSVGSSTPDCLGRLEWNGVKYASAGGRIEKPLVFGNELGTGIIPGCSGAAGQEVVPDREVTVVRVRGTSPSVAVAIEDEGDPPYPWLAPGYVPESALHPLHEAIYGSANQPNAEAGFRCEVSRTLGARALTTPAFDVVPLHVEPEEQGLSSYLRAGDVDGIVTFDANSVITGYERDGIPFIQAGDRFSLSLRECTGTDEAGPGMSGLRMLVVKKLSRLIQRAPRASSTRLRNDRASTAG